MIIGIICFIMSIAGIIGFYNEIYVLTYIALIFNILEVIVGVFTNQLKRILTFLLGGIIGWIITGKFWLGLAIGLCFENIILFASGIILMIITTIATKNKES